VKFLFEARKRSAARNLRAFLEAKRELFAADCCFCADGGMLPNDQPSIVCGVRGILYVEVAARGANRDVHSGNLGPFVPAPGWRLVQFLATLQDADGRIRIRASMTPCDRSRPRSGRRWAGSPSSRASSPTWVACQRRTVAGLPGAGDVQPSINICGLASGMPARG